MRPISAPNALELATENSSAFERWIEKIPEISEQENISPIPRPLRH
jgi:hypothetical protein